VLVLLFLRLLIVIVVAATIVVVFVFKAVADAEQVHTVEDGIIHAHDTTSSSSAQLLLISVYVPVAAIFLLAVEQPITAFPVTARVLVNQ
jgi:hypothetical protein